MHLLEQRALLPTAAPVNLPNNDNRGELMTHIMHSTDSAKKKSAFFAAWMRQTGSLVTHTGNKPDVADSPKQRKRAIAKALRRAVKTPLRPVLSRRVEA